MAFANWQEDAYEAQPFNTGNVVKPNLDPELWREYRNSWRDQMGPTRTTVLYLARMAHNIVRNADGLVFLVTLPALLWARNRLLTCYLLTAFGLMLGTYAVSSGYSMRFEHVLIPTMLMISTIAVHTLIGIAGTGFRWRRFLV